MWEKNSREFTHINSDSLLEDANIKDERTDTEIASIHVQRRNVQRRQYNGEQRRCPQIKWHTHVHYTVENVEDDRSSHFSFVKDDNDRRVLDNILARRILNREWGYIFEEYPATLEYEQWFVFENKYASNKVRS